MLTKHFIRCLPDPVEKYDWNIAMSEREEAQNAAGHLAHSRVARFWLKELHASTVPSEESPG
jgi:hypothetical protein